MALTFKRSKDFPEFYQVRDGDTLIGSVKRVEGWTVRGAPVRWEARRKGRYLGSADTRKDAAALILTTAAGA